jgi:hypothetical protein
VTPFIYDLIHLPQTTWPQRIRSQKLT